MASINLLGRMPVPRPTISGRLLLVAGGVFVIVICGIVYGFHLRFARQQARKEQQHSQVTASDAAPSNRQSVEGEVPVASLSGGQAPQITTTSSPAAAITKPLVDAAQTVAHPFPGGEAQQPAAAPLQQPAYAAMPLPQTADSEEDMRRQALQRRYARQQQAMEAPTGVQEQRAVASTASGSVDPLQGDIAQLNALLHPSATASTAGQLPGAPLGAFVAPGAEGSSGYRGQNAQGEKRQFQEGGEGPGDDYLKTTRTPPLSPWVVQRGTVIPAALPHRLVSDLPGDLIAEVQRDVYDSPSQKYVMIPAGSRLVGEYNSSVSYGQNRVQVVWVAIYFPDGSFIDLDRMPSHSADGAVGLKDQVDNHWKRVIAGVALSSILAAGLQISQNRTNGSVLTYPSAGQEASAAIGTQAAELGQQLTNRNLNIQPTLKIRPGEIFAVSVKKDMLLPGPYTPLPVK